MKTTRIFGLLVIAIVILASCQEQKMRYTQASPEIDTFKAAIADYESSNWEGYMSHYADTAKIYHNTKDKPLSAKESADLFKEQEGDFASRGFIKDEGDMEMVVTDDGETWVNFWGEWQGTLAANNKVIDIPVHLTAQFIDGKIVKEYGYWDGSQIMASMMEIAAAAKMTDSTSAGETMNQ
ncbi:hypothetical protein ATE92_1682 [Ulvibacter sp. MAR_2010_11]|uniref:nuclear transport factor 2 family protein n=1 Tax=Ulvibacter sp. MAR_2010_11 TaxID=1250229 RepID=UPI000C2C61AE|nr:nuclear transport factor 2 family protein [Ulvibacter sp. MAR_2010_11]PKA83527.1 hypothetical protein ATE92_1682 [Ulvibacter sp. MAR_2010_11]